MPTTITIEQIDEVLNNSPSKIKKSTWKAVQDFLNNEKNRRINSAKSAGRKRIYEGDTKERNKLSARNYRKKAKIYEK